MREKKSDPTKPAKTDYQEDTLVDLCSGYIQQRLQDATPGQEEAVRFAGSLIFTRYMKERNSQQSESE